MTAQIREMLIYKGEVTTMATEPLEQYLQNRSDINFVGVFSSCHRRGYSGTWEIKDRKLYLIGFHGWLNGFEVVELDYLFPGQNTVFANWFSGKIRIPQGEMLEYVHWGYESLYERDLILVFENGLLTNEYTVDNEQEYKNRIKQIEMDAKEEKKDKIFKAISLVSLPLALIGLCGGVYNLLRQQTTLTYGFSVLIVIPLLLIMGGVIFLIANKGKNSPQEENAVKFIAKNFLVFVFIGNCIELFYLIKWGTMLTYFISAIVIINLLYWIFLAIDNQLKKKNIEGVN